ncbi:MAG: aminotransferase class V-fold PLP-dependent enzyme [Ilumatobacteraceae bacterium]
MRCSVGVVTRDDAAELDAADPLAPWRDRFVTPDGLVYLDGNSLGMAPRGTLERLADVGATEWADGLIRSWDHWLGLPTRVGDRLAPIIGAPPGSVVVHDSTTVNLYQLVHAALGLAASRGRPHVLAVPAADFPTDRYVVAGIARATGAELRHDVNDVDGVGVVVQSLVDYRTATLADLAAETRRARDAGAVIVWDLSHAAGAVEVDVAAAGAELAVGCAYKFLHGGPGAPAWSFVAPSLQAELDQPIWGWFAQRAQFEMGEAFEPHDDIRRLLLGTPGVLGLAGAAVGIGHVADAGMEAIAAKGRALTSLALDLCAELGLRSTSPVDPARRGAHVAVCVERADDVHAELAQRGVITDVRRPNLIRVGCAALTTRFVDVFDGVRAIAEVVGAR